VADVVAREILTLQSKAPKGGVASGLDGDSALRLVVHQATGMVAAQLDIDMAAALVRLRARAYAEGIPLVQVATEVVNRERRFS
jgi:ANTAR domain